MNQYNEEEHRYTSASGRLPGATDIIKSEGLINTDWMSEDARWRGKVVHRGIELLNRDELDWNTVAPEHIGYLESYLVAMKALRFELVGCEEPLFSSAFGCLPDTWGILNGQKTIIELKTGAVPAWAAFQTALQQKALADDRKFFATKRFGLQLLPTGKMAKLIPFNDPRDLQRAMGMLDMFWWKHEHGYLREWN